MKSKKLLLFVIVALSFGTALTATAQNTANADQNAPNEEVILQWNRVLAQTLQIPGANWESLLGVPGTPPHPSYASNASSASASLATTLALFYERDDVQFQINSGGTPNNIRNYRSSSVLTNEIARSRVFGGVHFPFDIAAGQSAGRSVANYVFLNYLTPRRCNL